MPEEKKLLSSLRLRYNFALCLLAALSFTSYFILQENIKSEEGAASAINISGRQRMLSQRIALFSLRLVNAPQAEERERLREELKGMIGLMAKSHNGLLNGDKAMNLTGRLSPGMKAIYFSGPLFLHKQVQGYIQEARQLVAASDSGLGFQNPSLKQLLDSSEGALLKALDTAVRQYQKESEEKIRWLEAMQFFVLVCVLIILMVTGAFIFRPMISRIHGETLRLKEQSTALAASNERLLEEINERRHLEEELRSVNEFDETLLRTIPFGIDIVDEENNILYLNEKMRNIFGEDARGRKCYLLYKDDKLQCPNCPLKKAIQIGQTEEIEVSNALNGRVFLITHTGMFYQGKKAILEIFEDITDYKKVQERLALSDRLAGIGRMAGVIAHEFRNQLGVIRNVSYFLKMKISDKDEKVRRHLGILDEQVMETERIIANILNFSRSKHPELQKTELRSLLLSSIDKVTIPRGIELAADLGEAGFIQADPVQLGGVFVNMLLNAVQAMEESGKLLISVEKKDNYVNIIFKDSGCGIKEEDRKRLFEPFFSTKARGTGLGLATAKGIVEAHGGGIKVESERGKGTTVIIRLPL